VATVSDIVDRVRLELADQGQSFVASLTGDGTSTRFQLQDYPVDGTTMAVTVNGVAVASAAVGVEERTGVLIFTTAPALNATIKVSGTAYRYFTYTDLSQMVGDAASQHLYHQVDTFGGSMSLENMPEVEVYPLSVLATSVALQALATDSAFDIDIQAPDGVSIPRSERYRQLSERAQERLMHYQLLCEALGIGMYKVEIFTMRRVSRMTNKYVPIYRHQEIEDYSQPKRVYLPIPTYGADSVPETTATYDLVIIAGHAFSITFDFDFDITLYTIAATIKSYVGSNTNLLTLTVNSTNSVTNQVVFTLTPTQTRQLPPIATWELDLTSVTDTTDVLPYIKGRVYTSNTNTLSQGGTTTTYSIAPPLLKGTAQSGFTVMTAFSGTEAPL
jgi:hypothetical protein